MGTSLWYTTEERSGGRPFSLKSERGKKRKRKKQREKNGEGLTGNGRRLRKSDRCARQVRTACSLLWDDPTYHRSGHDHTAQAYSGSVAEPSVSEARRGEAREGYVGPTTVSVPFFRLGVFSCGKKKKRKKKTERSVSLQRRYWYP